MVTTISTTLAVSEYFDLAQFGEIVLTAGRAGVPVHRRPTRRPSRATRPSSPTWPRAGSSSTTTATTRTTPPAARWPTSRTPTRRPGLSTENYVRGGDTITGLTGVMEYSFGAWKLRPVPGEDYTFERGQPAPGDPRRGRRPAAGGQLQRAQLLRHVDTTSSNSIGTLRARRDRRLPRRRLRAGAAAPARQDRRGAGDHRRRRLRAHRDPERRRSGHPADRRRAQRRHGAGHATTTSRPASSAPTPSSRPSSTRRRP